MSSILTHGKWILAGEHSVVRGGPALVFPLPSRSLTLSTTWKETTPQLRAALGAMIEAAEKYQPGRKIPSECDRLSIESDIPVSSGLGSSAALSVAFARYLAKRKWISEEEIFPLAKAIEDRFHGKSSGLDIASVMEGVPIRFQKGSPWKPIPLNWIPRIFLADTGVRSSTKDCVIRVENLKRLDLDARMSSAVDSAERALGLDEARGTPILAEAMNTSASCFEEWGLLDSQSRSLRDDLLRAGALAVKPTGSGHGGFLISLWKDSPKLPGLFSGF